MLDNKPRRCEELGRERVRLELRSFIARFSDEKSASEDVFLIDAGLVAERNVAQLVRSREPLDRQRALRGHDDALIRVVEVRAEEALKWPEYHRDVPVEQHAKHIDPTLALLGTTLRIVFFVQPIRFEDGIQDSIATRHGSSLLFLLSRPQEICEPR